MRLPTPFFDVFCCLMGIFLLFNVMISAYFNEAPERSLPPMDLASAKGTKDSGLTALKPLALSIKLGKNNRLCYFINKEEVTLKELQRRLSEIAPRDVVLRVDRRIMHGDVIKVMVMLERQGVKNISFAYKRVRKND